MWTRRGCFRRRCTTSCRPGTSAHFVRDTVRSDLDLSAILRATTEERGYPPYHPAMMVALLLYGYSQGVYSSRQLARACEERVDFMAVTGMNRPDFRTIASSAGGIWRRWAGCSCRCCSCAARRGW